MVNIEKKNEKKNKELKLFTNLSYLYSYSFSLVVMEVSSGEDSINQRSYVGELSASSGKCQQVAMTFSQLPQKSGHGAPTL